MDDCSFERTFQEGSSSAYWNFDHENSCIEPSNATFKFSRGADPAAGVSTGGFGIEKLYVVIYDSRGIVQIEERSLVFPEGNSSNPNFDIRPKGTLPPLSSRSGATASTAFGALALVASAATLAVF